MAPSARVSAAGTASANAQGQEITSTAIAAGNARAGSKIAHTAAVSAVRASTRATKRPAASSPTHLQSRTLRMRAADERGDSRERRVRADAFDAQQYRPILEHAARDERIVAALRHRLRTRR